MKKNQIFSHWRKGLTPWGKILKTMKVFTFLMLVAIVHVSASSYSQNSRLSLNMKNASIKDVLMRIEEQTEYRFLYSDSKIDVEKKVNIDLADMKIEDILDTVFDGTDIGYRIVSRQILLSDKSESSQVGQQPKTITGKVTDSSGQPLPGVTIVVKGTTKGTITDGEGNYSLPNVPESGTLVFSFVGMKAQEIPIAGKSSINVKMEEDAIGLDEVVAVGYGTQKKVNLTGAVNSINSKEIAQRQVGQSSMLLQGMSPGVTVSQFSGQPGKDSGSIKIRGIGTLNDANPLILVDGVPMDLNNVDPNIIENISILKDAASAAIYGARAANGVILVTTKRGSGKDFLINYSGYMGIQKPTNLKQRVNAADHMALLNVAYKNTGRTPLYSDELIANYNSLHQQDPITYPDTNWFDEIFTEDGLTQNHSLDFQGGTEKIKILGAIGYYSQDAIYINSGFDRYSLRLNSDIKINPKLSVKADVFFQFMETDEPGQETSNILFYMNHLSALEPTKNSFGYAVPSTGSNPLALLHDGGYYRTYTPSLLLNLGFTYNFSDDLFFGFNYSPHLWQDNTKQFKTIANVYYPNGDIYAPGSQITSLLEKQSSYINNNTWATLNYKKNIGKHNVGVLLGASQEDYSNKWFSAFRDTYELPRYDVLNAGDPGNMKANGSGYDWALRSIFGRINYDFQGKYLFEANVRYDGSSRFSSGHKFGFFPSFSAGWRISEEKFWNSYKNVVDNLKLRLSWGQLGNQNIGNYPFDSFLTSKTVIFNDQIIKGLTTTDMANPEISWETTEMLNSGLDISFLDHFTLAFDYYYKKTKGILLQLDIPSYIGLSAPYQNAGVVENKGWDLLFGYNGRKNDFTYNLSFTLSDVKNKILDLKGANVADLLVNFEGYPMNSFYGYEAIGFFQSIEEIAESPTQTGNIISGNIKYKDQDDNGVINADDRKIIGNRIPRYTYSLNASFGWGNLDFSFFLQGVGKVDGYLNGTAIMPFYNGSTALEMHKDYWTPENPNAKFPSLAFNETNDIQNSSFWVKNASYLRVKNIQLGYTFNKNKIHFIRNLRVYMSGQNLFTFDKFWDGFDVEAPVGNGAYYPQEKLYSIGVNVTF